MNLTTISFQLSLYTVGDPNVDKLAIVCPGKLDTKDYPHMRSLVEMLANQGYFALSFDPPGSWESVNPSLSDEQNIAMYTMGNYLQAICEIIAHFGNKPTFVVGHSSGGSMAMLAGVHVPQVTHFASIMSFYTFDPKVHVTADLRDWQEAGVHYSRRDLPDNPDQFKTFSLPFSFYEDQIQYDISEGLKTCNKPKLFIAGLQDKLVSPRIVKTAYDLSAEPKVYKEIDCGHDYRKSPELIEKVNGVVREFVAGL